MITRIEYKEQEITVLKLAHIIKGRALSFFGTTEYFFITVYSEDYNLSADIKFRISDHFPNPMRCDERTCSFSLCNAQLHVGSHREGYMFLDESCQLTDEYESIVDVLNWEIEKATRRFE